MVYVYITDVSGLPDPLKHPEVMECLTEDRKQKILKYRQQKDRKQGLGAGLLLLKVLEKHGKAMGEVHYIENGKPVMEGICFNLSHSADMAVCAISERSVGIDIEKIDDVKTNIALRYFTLSENKYLNQFAGEEKQKEFFRLWTMKESYMKMTGEGMKLALNCFEFIINEVIKVYRDGKLCECQVKEYEVPGYKLTVCAEEKEFANKIEYIELTQAGAYSRIWFLVQKILEEKRSFQGFIKYTMIKKVHQDLVDDWESFTYNIL